MPEEILAPIAMLAALGFLGWSTATARKRGYEIGPWMVFWGVMAFGVVSALILGFTR